MKKLFIVLLILIVSASSVFAGSVDGKLTKIRVYEEGRNIRFKSKIPNLTYIVRKIDVLKGMTRRGKTLVKAKLEKNGLILDFDKKTLVTLDRVGDGLYIKSKVHTMYVTEKELEKVR